MKMTIYLLRHGKTAANEQKLYCGSTDLPLSPEGAAELLRLKTTLAFPDADVLVHSGLARTKETMSLLTGKETGIPVPELQEMRFGDFELQSYDMLKEDSRYLDWITDKRPAPPGGESKAEFRTRVLMGFDTLLSLCPKDKSLAAFVHGGVIAVLMDALFPGKRNFYEWQPAFGRGYCLRLVNKQAVEFFEI